MTSTTPCPHCHNGLRESYAWSDGGFGSSLQREFERCWVCNGTGSLPVFEPLKKEPTK